MPPAQPPSPPYSAFLGAPLSSAASLAACEGLRCSHSFAYRRRPSATFARRPRPRPAPAARIRPCAGRDRLPPSPAVRPGFRRARFRTAWSPRASTAGCSAPKTTTQSASASLDAMRGFVEHQGARFARERGEAFAVPRPWPGGSPRTRSGRWPARRPRARRRTRTRPAPADRDPGGTRGAHQAKPRVADQRRAGVRHQRQRFAGEQAFDQFPATSSSLCSCTASNGRSMPKCASRRRVCQVSRRRSQRPRATLPRAATGRRGCRSGSRRRAACLRRAWVPWNRGALESQPEAPRNRWTHETDVPRSSTGGS